MNTLLRFTTQSQTIHLNPNHNFLHKMQGKYQLYRPAPGLSTTLPQPNKYLGVNAGETEVQCDGPGQHTSGV